MKTMLFALVAVFASLIARAETSSASITTPASETNSNRVTIPDLLINKKFEENKEITDAKLKADGGSLSQYSLSFTLSYYGPTAGDLGAADQPNPDGRPGTYATSLGGSIGGRFRLDSSSSVTAGTGMKALHPFHGMDRFDTNNPYVNYNLSAGFWGVQMRNTFGYSLVTNPDYKKIGETSGLNWDTSTVYNIGTTRFAVGIDTSISYYFFNRGYIYADKKASLYQVSAYPTAKYNITDKFSANTSLAFSSYNPRYRNQSVLMNTTMSQRLGVGYAYTRDIYVSPYLNFYTDHLSQDGTTINFSTVFSVL
jgi:hypothetical protein